MIDRLELSDLDVREVNPFRASSVASLATSPSV